MLLILNKSTKSLGTTRKKRTQKEIHKKKNDEENNMIAYLVKGNVFDFKRIDKPLGARGRGHPTPRAVIGGTEVHDNDA